MEIPFPIWKDNVNNIINEHPLTKYKEVTVKKIILPAVLLMLVVSISMSQTTKIAYVNSQKVIAELPEAQQVQKEIESNIKIWQDELERMGKEFQEGLDDYQKKEALLDQKAKDEKQKNLQGMQQRIREYQYQKFDQREGEVVKMREKKFAPIQEKIMKVIEQIAKADKYTYVVDAAGLLYADDKYEITFKVIDRLRTGSASAPAKSKEK
jgi:outer membrane protein